MSDDSDSTEHARAVDHVSMKFLGLGQGQTSRIDFVWIRHNRTSKGFVLNLHAGGNRRRRWMPISFYGDITL